MSHFLGLGASVLACAGDFILLDPDKARNLAVILDQERKVLCICFDHQCPSGGGKDDPFQDEAGLLVSD